MAEVQITKSEIHQLMDQLDLNGDGMIDYSYVFVNISSFSIANILVQYSLNMSGLRSVSNIKKA